MKNKIPIDNKQLEELLKSFYLDDRSKVINENDAQFVMSQNYDAQPDPVKEQQVLSRLNKNYPGRNAYQFFMTVLLIVITIGLFVPVFFQQKTSSGKKEETKFSAQKTENEITPVVNDYMTSGTNTNLPSSAQNTDILTAPDTFGRIKTQSSLVQPDSITPALNEISISATKKHETPLPYLTEKDRNRYQTVKNLMLLKLYKADKNLYTHVVADKMEYRDSVVIMEPFSIRNMGITNLEYKTFLADLLAQNRKDDYLEAQVKFNNQQNSVLSIDYFQKEKYNDFPVVNISTGGAQLFCNWLEEELKIYIRLNKLKEKQLQIRLPADDEWIFIARQGYAKVSYDRSAYNTIFDPSEGLVNKSFVNRIELITKRTKRSDTLFPLFSTNRYGWNEKENLEFFSKAFNSFNYLPADTIYPQRMKVFCKVGHVSEIALKKYSRQPVLIGMTWKQKEDYLKLLNEFKTAGASPFVGFRFVVINSDDSEYKNPFW